MCNLVPSALFNVSLVIIETYDVFEFNKYLDKYPRTPLKDLHESLCNNPIIYAPELAFYKIRSLTDYMSTLSDYLVIRHI